MSTNVKDLEEILQWKEDCAVVNDFGEYVFLTACFNSEGKRIGITDCCFVINPCKKHKKLKEKESSFDETSQKH